MQGPVLSGHKKLVAEKLAEEEADQKVKGDVKKEKHLVFIFLFHYNSLTSWVQKYLTILLVICDNIYNIIYTSFAITFILFHCVLLNLIAGREGPCEACQFLGFT